jgi:hypothetical protein
VYIYAVLPVHLPLWPIIDVRRRQRLQGNE